MKIRLAFAVAALTVALVAAGAASALIVPQKSIAGVRLGQTKAQIRAKLGAPPKVRRINNDFGLFVEYVYPRVSVGFQGDQTVTSLTTTSPKERTARGIGVGSTVAQVEAKLPEVQCKREFGFRHCWIGAFEVGKTVTDLRIQRGKVSSVRIGYVID